MSGNSHEALMWFWFSNSLAPDALRFQAHEEFLDRREGVVSARTYFYEDEAKCDENLQTFKDCIDAVAGQ